MKSRRRIRPSLIPLSSSMEHPVLVQRLERGGTLSAQLDVESFCQYTPFFPRSDGQEVHEIGPTTYTGRTAQIIGRSTQRNDPLIATRCQACVLAQEIGGGSANDGGSFTICKQASLCSWLGKTYSKHPGRRVTGLLTMVFSRPLFSFLSLAGGCSACTQML